MKIRKAVWSDLDSIMEIYQQARQFMVVQGNPSQWGEDYPPRALIEADIEVGQSYVCVEGDRLVGVFALMPGPDPTYERIEGAFRSQESHGVIHRLASDGRTRGVARACFTACGELYSYLRIDTHRDNRAMRGALEKYGFVECGLIWVEDGSERLAFDFLPFVNHFSKN
ncbi:GNAT family N-acetyltransferase [Streptococcus danieliae]|uniref:GNAT family N-acetyltransferase n=1 Tax=Streptococcus danieliae TaxID=747656 RepID=UPI0017B5EAC3|nr:N-acetyltransferase [Streptococcus danieliae]MCU0082784.1 N-acetyltransferase [Streptococcus danieliae]NYS33344.1 N-acetyltransferase [Streptococcus danieliae]